MSTLLIIFIIHFLSTYSIIIVIHIISFILLHLQLFIITISTPLLFINLFLLLFILTFAEVAHYIFHFMLFPFRLRSRSFASEGLVHDVNAHSYFYIQVMYALFPKFRSVISIEDRIITLYKFHL